MAGSGPPKDDSEAPHESDTMLSTYADTHPVLRQHHRIKDEKQVLVLQPHARRAKWRDAPVERSIAFVTRTWLNDRHGTPRRDSGQNPHRSVLRRSRRPCEVICCDWRALAPKSGAWQQPAEHDCCQSGTDVQRYLDVPFPGIVVLTLWQLGP
jgi:hypothetical protein